MRFGCMVMEVAFLLLSVIAVIATTADTLKWDYISTTWPKFLPLPMKEQEALDDGWSLISDDCIDYSGPFVGRRFALKNDRNIVVIFDSHGQIAGMQSGYKAELKPHSIGRYQSAYIYNEESDGAYYYLTVYFTEPGKICCYCVVRPTDVIGDKLIFLTDVGSPMVIPAKTDDLENTKWILGRCVITMGIHYWYDMTRDMDCLDRFPFFILYNTKGELHGFALGHDIALQHPRYEIADPRTMPKFMKEETLPQCLYEMTYRTPSMHVFLTNVTTFTHGC